MNVTRPSAAVRLVVPCNVPLPARRAALTTVLLSIVPLAVLRRLPNWSCTSITGCCAKTTPAVAVADGWVRRTSLLAAPATSRRAPKLELVATPVTLAVPVTIRLPVAKGEPAVGRTRTFCQVSLVSVVPELVVVTV